MELKTKKNRQYVFQFYFSDGQGYADV